MNKRYPNLFSPLRIGGLEVKNRIFMGPTETLYASAWGEVTPQVIEFYRRRAEGGAGLLVLHSAQGNTGIDPYDPYAGSLRLDGNAYIPMLSDLTEAVHRAGAKIAALVSLGGGAAAASEPYELGGGAGEVLRVAPSARSGGEDSHPARALSGEEIKKMTEAYGRCAWRARRAGFDAFYIHAVGSYLLAEFLSPLYNRREDAYGGSAENRWRLLSELVRSCRRQAGEDFPLVLRISLDEAHPQGRTFAETGEFLPRLEEQGIAAFDVTAGNYRPLGGPTPSIYVERGVNLGYAQELKKLVSVPVVVSGKLYEPDFAEEVLAGGKADAVSLGRGLIAEPDWPRKVQSGRTEEIRRCLSCNHCLGKRIINQLPLRCAFNPEAGREGAYHLRPRQASGQKKIVIIGGGPAGLELAYRLGTAGHTVEVYEKTGELCGGQIKTAQRPPNKEELSHLGRFYQAALALDNVRLFMGREIDGAALEAMTADLFVVATGGRPLVPAIPGIDGKNVFAAQDVLNGASIADGTVLVAGGGQIGCETAHFLARAGKAVTVVELLPQLIPQEEPITRGGLLHLLNELGVKSRPGHKITEIGLDRVMAVHLESNRPVEFVCDAVVTAFGTRPAGEIAATLERLGKNYTVIGDARRAGNIGAATEDGYFAACALTRLLEER